MSNAVVHLYNIPLQLGGSIHLIACGHVFVMFLMLSVTNLANAAPITDEEKHAFQWFDALGFPSLEGSRWVRVATGQSSQRGDRPPENSYFNTFLLKAVADRFTVFTVDGSTLTFIRSGAGVPEYKRVGYEPRNLEADARAYLETLRHPPADVRERIWQRFGERISQRAEAFITARGCAAHGFDELAHELCVLAEAMPDRDGGKKLPFLKRLSDDFAYSAIWKAFLDFEDTKIARPQLLATFRDFVAHFPDGQYTARAKETAEILEKMVKEDQDHARASTRPVDQLPVKDRVAELIFQLRDQHGQQWSQPGACDIFFDERGDKTPASQLVAIGFDAVPQLIDALDDDRFTRSVGYHRNFYFSHFVLRVGDCAEAVLSRIACRPFWVSKSSSGAMLKDGQADDTRRQVQQWWADVQKKGEKQVLAEAVASGDAKATEQARRLVEKYADAALEPIKQGVANAQSEYLRVQLVQLAGQLKGDAPLPFLNGQLTQGASVDVRVTAANALRARGNTQVIDAMIDEWRRQCDAANGSDAEAPGSLIQFLFSSDDPRAIQAVQERIQVWPVSSRLQIAESLGLSGSFSVMSSGSGPAMPGAAANSKSNAATLDAIEDLLISQLHDAEERGGMSGTIDGEAFTNPRVCDMAAHALAVRWKERYSFRLSAPRAERDRQRVVFENAWRSRHNLPALPVPQPRKIDPVPREQIDPLLQLLASPAEAARAKAAGDIEALGPGALPTVRQALAAAAPEDARRSALLSLAQRLSCRVEQIDVLPADCQPDGDLKTALNALKGNALTSEALAGVLISFARKQPQGIHGIRLYATRGDDFTGFEIRVQMLPGKIAMDSDWSIEQSVSAAGEGLLGSFGSASANGLQRLAGWEDLTRALTMALTSPPETPIEVRVALRRK